MDIDAVMAQIDDPALQQSMLKSYYESTQPKPEPPPAEPTVPEPDYPKEPDWSDRKAKRIEAIARELWPFLLAEVAVLLAIAYWADLTLFVPRLLGLAR